MQKKLHRLSLPGIAALVGFLSFSICAASFHPVSVVDPSFEISLGGNGNSCAPIISPDGRYVLFASTGNNFLLTTNNSPMPDSFPARINVFLRDRIDETTALISADLAGVAGGNGDSIPSGMSTNGQFIVFESSASDLVVNDSNNVADIFVRDRANGTNILVSVSTNGGTANGVSRGATIAQDGRYVSFVSAATNLVSNDTNGIPDVFIRDLLSGTTTNVSGSGMASGSSSTSESPEISADGRYVAFHSTTTNQVVGVDTTNDLYVIDFFSGSIAWVSSQARSTLSSSNVVCYNHAISADGKFIAYAARRTSALSTTFIFRYNVETGFTDLINTNAIMSAGPSADRTLDISADGRFIAFLANTNIGAGTLPFVGVWDAQTGSSTVASRDITNGIASGSFEWPSIDSSGRFVCFISTATNLTTNSLGFGYHVFVRDLLSNQTALVDSGSSDFISYTIPAFCANGRFVAFESFDTQQGAENTRRNVQVYLRDLQTNTMELISARHPALPSVTPNAWSDLSSMSVNANGRFIAFASLASNLAANDTNANRDIFVRDLLNETNLLISVATNGFSAAGMSLEPAISSDGAFVAFTSTASNLALNDTNKLRDVFVFDLQTKVMNLGSISTNGLVGNNASHSPVVSENGRYLFFRSKASNLATGSYTANSENLFWRDLQTATTVALITGGVGSAAITPDGRYAAYRAPSGFVVYVWDSFSGKRVYTNSSISGIVAGISPNGKRVAYTSGTQLHALDWITKSNWSVGSLPSVVRAGVKFSADGKFLTFASTTVQAGIDGNTTYDVYLYDLESNVKTLVSHASNSGNAANAASDYPDISFDGRFVTYRSAATNLVANDTNNFQDIFVFDRLTGINTLLSANRFGNSGNNRSLAPIFSRDGRTLVFPSWASDLVANDFNYNGDLFSFAFLYATVTQGNPGEGPIISWPAVAGGNYQVQFKNDLNDSGWQELTGTITFTGNQAFIQDGSPSNDQRIYRVVAF